MDRFLPSLESLNKILKYGSISIDDIEDTILREKGYCIMCEKPFVKGNIKHYEHTGGIYLLGLGLENKRWVYFHCDKCQYDSSLNKVLKRLMENK